MSNRPEGTKYQTNLKTPAGSLINLYAETPEEMSAQLEAVEGLAAQIAALEGVFNAAQLTKKEEPWEKTTREHMVSQAVQQQGSAAPSCEHGLRVHKSGVGKSGKPWSGWFCPQPRGQQQCDPKWG